MTKPPRVWNFRQSGFPPGAVDIMRPSVWGNPFRIGGRRDRKSVLQAYAIFLEGNPELCERARRELRGKDLVCCCFPQACHGTLLLKLANSGELI